MEFNLVLDLIYMQRWVDLWTLVMPCEGFYLLFWVDVSLCQPSIWLFSIITFREHLTYYFFFVFGWENV
ncbi:hypothetical protein QBC38DRAFT_465364 [Podospora fimiseda]|uniref:Uncharacterized protein n=1 Tax=Podospora fimiseda TaxID=252190 RepID=A0AAN7H862_9PEZI|nr:hypothetical protein QBC38DRAFT_465364 [Podospora fimiseda]